MHPTDMALAQLAQLRKQARAQFGLTTMPQPATPSPLATYIATCMLHLEGK